VVEKSNILNSKKTIQIHTGNGELVDCEIKQKRSLAKNDRMIDHSTIGVMMELSKTAMRILLKMFQVSNKRNFVANSSIVIDCVRQTKSLALLELTEKDLINKAIWVKSEKKHTKGWMLNPFHFRKTRSIDVYFELVDIYEDRPNNETIILAASLKDVIEQHFFIKEEETDNNFN